MSEDLYWTIWLVYSLSGLLVFPILFFISASYGKFAREGFGPKLRNDIAWFFQESPSFYVFLLLMRFDSSLVAQLLSLMFLVHYFNRSIIYPWRMPPAYNTNLTVALLAFLFTVTNGYLQAYGIHYFDQPSRSLYSPFFILGTCLWALGIVLNIRCDGILRDLKKTGSYKIPYGALFEYVTCGNYLAEIIEWSGWALAAGTITTASFALWTIANLLPRAHSQHQWYLSTFPTYKSLNRSRLIPGLF